MAQRLDGGVDAGVAGDHHDLHAIGLPLKLRNEVESGAVRQDQIEQNDVGRLGHQAGPRRGHGGGRLDRETLVGNQLSQRFERVLVVLDDQRVQQAGHPCPSAGSRSRNSLPRPGRFSTLISPPWASTIERAR